MATFHVAYSSALPGQHTTSLKQAWRAKAGGFGRDTEVLKALALGARMVFVGRATLYGTAVGGERGVRRVLSILVRELDRDMALLGCANIAQVDRSLLKLGADYLS